MEDTSADMLMSVLGKAAQGKTSRTRQEKTRRTVFLVDFEYGCCPVIIPDEADPDQGCGGVDVMKSMN